MVKRFHLLKNEIVRIVPIPNDSIIIQLSLDSGTVNNKRIAVASIKWPSESLSECWKGVKVSSYRFIKQN